MDLTQDLAIKRFGYDEDSGVLFYKERPDSDFRTKTASKSWHTKYLGNPAGCERNDGYLKVNAFGKTFYVHRICWLIRYGEMPENNIDHINGIRSDNRLVNLRHVDHFGNNRNACIRVDNASGVTGVSWNKKNKKWRVDISSEGKRIYLGMFSEISSAIACRKHAEKYSGYHANHGRAA